MWCKAKHMYHAALLLLRDVDDYGFLPNTFQNLMPRTKDRFADFASVHPHTRDGIPSCVYFIYLVLRIYLRFTFMRFKYNTSYLLTTMNTYFSVKISRLEFIPSKCGCRTHAMPHSCRSTGYDRHDIHLLSNRKSKNQERKHTRECIRRFL